MKCRTLVLVTGEYSLMISNAQLEDDADYECQVGQSSPTTPGIVSRKATLTVLSEDHFKFVILKNTQLPLKAEDKKEGIRKGQALNNKASD